MKIEIDNPVIPQFVADWIEIYVEYGYDLYRALKKMENNARHWERTYDWYQNNTLEFVLAYLTQEYEIEEGPLYYAKIKGWELATSKSTFWNYRYIVERPILSKLYVGGKESVDSFKTKMTIEDWNKVGINDTNADFEEVGE